MKKHGHATRSKRSSEYWSWHAMKKRCENDPRYLSRKIKVCERWNDFANFLEDMGEKPSRSYSIDRIDNDKGYFKENCRWATRTMQSLNRSVNKNSVSGVAGIRYDAARDRYHARVQLDGKRILNKRFRTFEEAKTARDSAFSYAAEAAKRRSGQSPAPDTAG